MIVAGSADDKPNYDDLDEDELLEELGLQLLGESNLGFSPADLGRYRRVAAQWLRDHTDELRNSICVNPMVQALTDDDAAAKITDVSIVADTISTMLGRPSATIVAVIVVRRGLDRFCASSGPLLGA